MENTSATHTSASQMIRDDHKRIRGLFTQLTAVDLRAHEMVNGVSEELFIELDVHARLEEEIFYPALENVVSFREGAILERGREEHDQVRRLILEIRDRKEDSSNSSFVDRVLELRETFEQHVEEEESVLLTQAEQVLGEELISLGDRMRERRMELMRGTSVHAQDPLHAQNPNGGEQKRKGAA